MMWKFGQSNNKKKKDDDDNDDAGDDGTSKRIVLLPPTSNGGGSHSSTISKSKSLTTPIPSRGRWRNVCFVGFLLLFLSFVTTMDMQRGIQQWHEFQKRAATSCSGEGGTGTLPPPKPFYLWEPPNDGTQCRRLVPELLQEAREKGRLHVNQLRRRLALYHATCFATVQKDFVAEFRWDESQSHLNLHIPKTGGSSLCEVAKQQGRLPPAAASKNCWIPEFYPLWCQGTWIVPPKKEDPPKAVDTSCQALANQYGASRGDKDATTSLFLGNEQHLRTSPLCGEDFYYSITVREPVARAMSHVHHFLGMNQWGLTKDQSLAEISGRLNLLQSNYMTWALVADAYQTDQTPAVQVRVASDATGAVERAKHVLEQLDFLMDFAVMDPLCMSHVLQLQGFGADTEMPHSNARSSPYQSSFTVETYQEMNRLDRQVYAHALALLQVDCDFWKLWFEAHPEMSKKTAKQQEKPSPPRAEPKEKPSSPTAEPKEKKPGKEEDTVKEEKKDTTKGEETNRRIVLRPTAEKDSSTSTTTTAAKKEAKPTIPKEEKPAKETTTTTTTTHESKKNNDDGPQMIKIIRDDKSKTTTNKNPTITIKKPVARKETTKT